MASEIVTEEMVGAALTAYDGHLDAEGDTYPDDAMRAALLAVAPLIRRAALEEAAAWHTQGALLAEREAENTTTPERRSELLLHARREQKAAAAIICPRLTPPTEGKPHG